MKVVLIQDVKALGKKGEIKEVSDGHARNYLIPNGLAKEATASTVKEVENQKRSQDKRKANELFEAQALASKLESSKLEIKTKVGEGGRLFGSITSKDISDHLEKDLGIKVDKKKISVDSIKTAGAHEVIIKLYQGVEAKLQVIVSEI